MAYQKVGGPYVRTSSPFGGTSRSSFGGSSYTSPILRGRTYQPVCAPVCSPQTSYIRTHSPFLGTSRSSFWGDRTCVPVCDNRFSSSWNRSWFPSYRTSFFPPILNLNPQPTVVIHQDSNDVIVSRTPHYTSSSSLSKADLVVLGIVVSIIAAVAINAALTTREVCQQFCDFDVIPTNCIEKCVPLNLFQQMFL